MSRRHSLVKRPKIHVLFLWFACHVNRGQSICNSATAKIRELHVETTSVISMTGKPNVSCDFDPCTNLQISILSLWILWNESTRFQYQLLIFIKSMFATLIPLPGHDVPIQSSETEQKSRTQDVHGFVAPIRNSTQLRISQQESLLPFMAVTKKHHKNKRK